MSSADVYAYVATLLGDRAAAEDVTALTFERALSRRRSFDRGRGTERSWLFGIARNAALDALRRRKRTATRAAEPAELLDAGVVDADEAVDAAVRRMTVRAALQSLDPRDREVVALK